MIEFFTSQLPQIIGFVALVLGVAGYQFNSRRTILTFQASANFLWTIHFYLIGAFTGSAVNLVAVVRNYTFVKYRSSVWGGFTCNIHSDLYGSCNSYMAGLLKSASAGGNGPRYYCLLA